MAARRKLKKRSVSSRNTPHFMTIVLIVVVFGGWFALQNSEATGYSVLKESLTPDQGGLSVSATPTAKVYVDDILQGTTPLRMRITEGNHKVLVIASGYQATRVDVVIVPEKTTTLDMVLQEI
jgi:hypothetical protein